MGSKHNQSARSAYWLAALLTVGIAMGGFTLDQAWGAPGLDTSESVVHYHPVAPAVNQMATPLSKNARARTLNIGSSAGAFSDSVAPLPNKKQLGASGMEVSLKTTPRSLPAQPKAFMAKTAGFSLPKNAPALNNLRQLKAISPAAVSSTAPVWAPAAHPVPVAIHSRRKRVAAGSSKTASHKVVAVPVSALSPEKSAVKPAAYQSIEDTESMEPESDASSTGELSAEPSNTDGMPLDLSGKMQSGPTQTSTRMLLRITISLLVVLGLFVGFAKMLLPRLMAKYPQFFERLRRNQPAGGPEWEPSPQKASFFSSAKTEQNRSSNKKRYLERVDINGNRFNVKSTTQLGHGKELHLVEILGRQLVVATTPYSVTLIKDLTAGDSPSARSNDLSDALGSEISGFLTSGLHERAENSQDPVETDDYYNPSWQNQGLGHPFQADAEAYPQVSSRWNAVEIEQEPSYAPAEAVQQAASHKSLRPFASLPEPNPLDTLYLKYLDGSDRGPSWRKSQFLPDADRKDAYVDAEEVVVLEDYDDMYGR